MKAKYIVGSFDYPWLDDGLFDLSNCSIRGKDAGSISNGKLFG